MILFSVLFLIIFARCSQKNPDNTEESARETIGYSSEDEVDLDKDEQKIRRLGPAKDTLVLNSGGGSKLTTYIYEYLDSIPGTMIRKFVTLDKRDSIVLRSFNSSFRFYGEVVEGDFDLILIPSYSITENGLEIYLFNSNGAAGYNTQVNLDDVFRKSLFKSYDMEDGLLKIATAPLPPSNQKSHFFVTLKDPYVEVDSVFSLISTINQRPLYEIEKKVLFENAFLHSCRDGKNSVMDKFMSQEVDASDESTGHIIKATQYLYKFFKFHRLIE